MARTAIYLHTVVQPGCRIELAAPPGMLEGDELDVVLLTNDRPAAAAPRPLLDILDSLPHDIGFFKSAQDADAYIRDERDSWER
jgi:hypothetical protein